MIDLRFMESVPLGGGGGFPEAGSGGRFRGGSRGRGLQGEGAPGEEQRGRQSSVSSFPVGW